MFSFNLAPSIDEIKDALFHYFLTLSSDSYFFRVMSDHDVVAVGDVDTSLKTFR